MTQLRVHELAKECGVPARTILEFLSRIGMFAKWASSRLDPREPPWISRRVGWLRDLRFGGHSRSLPVSVFELNGWQLPD